MKNNNLSVCVGVRNDVYSVTFTDKKSGLSFGIMSKNPDKINEWIKSHLTK